jgi:hypothetical protein
VSTSYNTPDDIDDPPVGVIIPFGKHAGVAVADAPLPYLAWAYSAWTFTIYPELQRAIESRLGLPPDPQIRTGPAPAAQPPTQTQPAARVAQSNGHTERTVARTARPESGLDGFRRALDRCRREALLEFADDPDLLELVEDLFARVQRALGI